MTHHSLLRRVGTTLLLAAFGFKPVLAQDDPARLEPPTAPARVAGFEGELAPLHSLAARPGRPENAGLPEGAYYVPSTPETVRWGRLPNRLAEPVLTVPSGSVLVVDAVSHEGILEDQGRDPAGFFGRFGIPARHVLDDAKAIAASPVAHDFARNGPHVVTGPIAVEGAAPGDVLMTEIVRIEPRVPYGVVSNRHGKGALPGEFPRGPKPDPAADATRPHLYRNVSIFTPLRRDGDGWQGVMHNRAGEEVAFPARPFMGIMGVAVDTEEEVNSVPPGVYGGNLDVNELGEGATLFLPVRVPGALFYTGDPHAAQGDGEVALTALELSARATFRLTVLKPGDPRIPDAAASALPFGETAEFWIPIGLNKDLDEAMKDAVRRSLAFLDTRLAMDPATALAYLSAAADYEVSQVVDGTKGVHALIRKSDFARTGGRAAGPGDTRD